MNQSVYLVLSFLSLRAIIKNCSVLRERFVKDVISCEYETLVAEKAWV